MRGSRAPVPLLLVGLALLLGRPSAALARPADAGKEGKTWFVSYDDTFDNELCGYPGTFHVVGQSHFQVKYVLTTGENANFSGLVNDHGSSTFTDAAGNVVVHRWNQTLKDLDWVDHGDGTYTWTYVIDGMPEKLSINGKTVNMDRGRIVFQDTFYLGDLSTSADDCFISGGIVDITGPHPNAERDFELYCQLIGDALG